MKNSEMTELYTSNTSQVVRDAEQAGMGKKE